MLRNETTSHRRLHEPLYGWARTRPGATALSDDEHRLDYAGLARAVDDCARLLSERGVRAGDRILLVAENCVELCVVILSISKLDAWSATVNARLSRREIDNFTTHSGARRVLYFDRASPDAAAHAREAGARALALPGLGNVAIGDLLEAEPEPVQRAAQDQVAALVYTSGTTGAPKAVMLTHGNLLFVGDNSRRMRRLVPGDVIYGVLPLSHVYGLSALLSSTLITGAHLRLAPRFEVERLVNALTREGITVLHGVPAMYAHLNDWAARNPAALRALKLRVAQAGGSPLTAPVKQDFEQVFGIRLHNGYGMTEASPSICQTRLDAPRDDCSVGQAIPGIEIRLAGDGTQQDVGELWVRGPNVMKGYYRAPEATAETVTADGWLKTGDLARIDADGAVFIVGRAKELIIRSGFNVYPIEVEQALNGWDEVLQSAVVGRTVEGNEEVIAFVEPVAGREIDLEALRAHLRANLSPYKVPARILVVEKLPAAATGKLLKAELRRLAMEA